MGLSRKEKGKIPFNPFCLIQARSKSIVACLGSASEYWERKLSKPECDCCISSDGNETVYLCLRLVTYFFNITLIASSFVSSVLFLRFVIIRKVDAMWKCKFLVQFH